MEMPSEAAARREHDLAELEATDLLSSRRGRPHLNPGGAHQSNILPTSPLELIDRLASARVASDRNGDLLVGAVTVGVAVPVSLAV